MAKVSPKNKASKNPKQNRQLRSTNSRYLKPGALAQARYNRASCSKSCADLGKKRVALVGGYKRDDNMVVESPNIDKSPLMSPVNFIKQSNLLGTPKSPQAAMGETESRLESLPTDLLVKILCHLHHDQLKLVFHVSSRVRKAVLLARQYYFNYTTPDRSRQEQLNAITPQPKERWPFISKGDGTRFQLVTPQTPKAPRHGPRPPARTKFTDMRQVAAVLFQESALPSRCMVPSVLARPPCKSAASHRVLFYEDELCQAVAQNKLR